MFARDMTEHEREVIDFMKQKQEENPETFADVCNRNPVLSARQWRRVREREIPLTTALAVQLGIESGDEDYSEAES